jgi:hypothetical protein
MAQNGQRFLPIKRSYVCFGKCIPAVACKQDLAVSSSSGKQVGKGLFRKAAKSIFFE